MKRIDCGDGILRQIARSPSGTRPAQSAGMNNPDARPFENLEAIIRADGDAMRARIDALACQVQVLAEVHSAVVDHVAAVKDVIERLKGGQARLELRMLSVSSRLSGVEGR